MVCSELDDLVSSHAGQNDIQGGPHWTLGHCPPPHSTPELPLGISAIPSPQRGLPAVSPTPPNQGFNGNTARLLPGHFLGLLPSGGHLDHVLQKGQPPFFDQQGAVLVRCGRGRQQVVRLGLPATCGPESTLAVRAALPEG